MEMSFQDVLEKQRDQNVSDLIDLLRIPSISAVPSHAGDVLRAADWLAARLRRGGFENVEIFPTGPHACVYGDWLHAPGKPTILIYGHLDVQPEDPLELWESPPFEPLIKDGRIYARGAADMKGNVLLSIIGAEALLSSNGSLPVNVKFLFEGQEEIGSRDLDAFVESHIELLKCDLVLSPDSIQFAVDQPAMIIGTKGLCSLQIDLTTADMDLHSGLYGGGVPNANHAMAELLASFHDKDGLILVDGFYDTVPQLTDTERKAIKAVPEDPKLPKNLGVDALIGEPGYSTNERLWARPTLEINGMWGGYTGDGLKTVIPAKAHAKISCRLVPNQDGAEIGKLLEAHIQKHKPTGARIEVTHGKAMARPYLVPKTHKGIQAVAEVLHEAYGKAPYFMRLGGSLPITDIFLHRLNAYTVMVGFGQEDERAHSPNEFLRLDDYARGQEVYARLLEKLSESKPKAFAI